MTTLNLQIAAGGNDGRETGGTPLLDDATGVIMPSNSPGAWAAFRFTSVTIPKGATVSAATLSLYVYTTSNDSPDVDVYAEDADNSAALSTTSNDISGRTLTTAKTTWTATNIGTGWKSPDDLTSVIQEVVDRSGWASGNALTILLDARSTSNDFRVRSYENDTTLAAKLDVTYTEPLISGAASITLGAVTTTAAGALPGHGAVAITLGGVTVGGPATITVEAAEDGWETPGGVVDIDSGGIDIISLDSRAAFIFRDLNIEQGTTIAAAAVEFWPTENEGISLSVQIETDTTPAPLVETNGNISGRTNVISVDADWSHPGGITHQYLASDDMTDVVQRVVNRNDWVAGDNGLSVIWHDFEGGTYLVLETVEGVHPPRLTLTHLAGPATATLRTHGGAAVTLGAVTTEAAGVLPGHAAAAIALDALTVEAAGAGVLGAAASITLGAVTISAAGQLPGHGSAAITLDGATVSASGELAAAVGTGQLIATLGAVTVAAVGALPGHGAAAITLDDVAAEGAGTSPRFGEAAITLDNLTGVGAARLLTHGGAAITLDDATAAGAGLLPLMGLADVPLDGLGLVAAGVLPGHGAAAVTLDGVTAAAAAGLLIQGATAVTLDGATVEGAASLGAHGEVSVVLAGVAVTAAGVLPGHGAVAITLDAATAEAAGALAVIGQSVITLEALSVTGAAVSVPVVIGAASITLGGVTAAGAGVSIIAAQASITLGAVTTTATAALVIVGQGAVTLDALTAVSAGALPVRGAAALALEPLTAGGAGVLTIEGAADIALGAVTVTAHAGQVVYGAAEITLGGVTVTATALLFLASIYIGVVRSPAGRGAVVYPRPVGSVRTAGDIE